MLQPTSQPTNQQSRVSVSIQRPLSHSTSHRSTNHLKRPLYRPLPQPISLRMWCSFQIYRLINKTKAQKKKLKVLSLNAASFQAFCHLFVYISHTQKVWDGQTNRQTSCTLRRSNHKNWIKKTAKKKICLWSLKSQVMTEWLLHLTDLFSQIPPSFWTFHPRPVIDIVWSLVKRFMQTFSGVAEAT